MSNPFLDDILVSVEPSYTVQDPKPEDILSYQEAIMVSQEAFNEVEKVDYEISKLINASISYSQLHKSMESHSFDAELLTNVSKSIGSTIGFEEAVVSLEGAINVATKVGKAIISAIATFFKKILNFIGILRNHSQKELARTKKVLDKISTRIKAEGNIKIKVSLSENELRWLHTKANGGSSTHINSALGALKSIVEQCVTEVMGKAMKESNGLAQENEVGKVKAIQESLTVSRKDLNENVLGDAIIHPNEANNAYTVTDAKESKGGTKDYEVDLETAKKVVEEIVIVKKFVTTEGDKLTSNSKKLDSVLTTVGEKAASTHDTQLADALKSIINELKGMVTESTKLIKHVEETSSHILNIYDRLVH